MLSRGTFWAPWRRRLPLAVVLSGLLHLVLAGVLIVASQSRRPLPPPRDAGTIEMVMVQQKGTAATPPRPTPHPAAQTQSRKPPGPEATRADPAPRKAAPSSAAAKQPSVPGVPAPPADKTDAAASAATAPAPPAAAPAPEKAAQASSAPSPKAPVFDLDGTDDDFNAIASGGRIIPASPDSRYRNNPPRYPREAAVRGEQGTVVLLIHVSETGMATGADVVRTSGVPSLDDAAMAAVRSWHFHPALREGKAVPFDVPFRFVFEGE